jgi:hypothetical protein
MMPDMSPDPQHARPESKGWTFWQAAFAAVLSLATLGTAGPAGYSVYRTSYAFAYPLLGRDAWILPVACEAAFMVLFGWGVLLAWKKVADVPVRVGGELVIAAFSFAIQVWAGRSSAADVLTRLTIVASFFVAGFTMKAAFMRLRGGRVRGDRLSVGEFLASPARAAGLWRWKNAWAEPSAVAARKRYLVLLYVIALAQADPRVGSGFRWRRNLPVTLRYELSTGLLPDGFSAGQYGWQESAAGHVREQLHLLGDAPHEVTPHGTPEVTAAAPEEAPAASPATTGGQQPAGQPHGNGDGTREGSDWPQTKDINKAVLARRVKAACERWERAHDGQRLPATQLGAELRVRMSRDTATALLKTAYGEQASPHRIGASR